jgi:hypothetical protein
MEPNSLVSNIIIIDMLQSINEGIGGETFEI